MTIRIAPFPIDAAVFALARKHRLHSTMPHIWNWRSREGLALATLDEQAGGAPRATSTCCFERRLRYSHDWSCPSSPAAACLPDLPPSARSRACSACARPRRATTTARCRTTSTARASSIRTASPPKSLADLVALVSRARDRPTWPELGAEPVQRHSRPRASTGPSGASPMSGHASLLLQTAGLNILIDPVWSQRVSPVSFAGPKRVNDPGIAFDALPPIDVVLVSHCHYDHLDVETLSRLHAAHRPRVITPLGNDTIMQEPRRRRSAPRPTTGTTASSSAAASPSRWCRRGTGRRAG